MRIGNSLPPADFNIGDSDPMSKLKSDVRKLNYNLEKYAKDKNDENAQNIRINAFSIYNDLDNLPPSYSDRAGYFEGTLQQIGQDTGDLSDDTISFLNQVVSTWS